RAAQNLSESSFIAGVGVATNYWKGLVAWAEAGSAIRYRDVPGVGRMIPDYRGGVSFSKHINLTRRSFYELNSDAVMLSRFRWDLLLYAQNRIGYRMPSPEWMQWSVVWNANPTTDTKRESWANFFDTGPGLRFTLKCVTLSLDALRGQYFTQSKTYHDLRAGLWYAITH